MSTSPAADRRIDTLHLRWYTLSRDRPADLADRWLAQCRASFPPALPQVFGDAEPLSRRLDDEGDPGFADALRRTTGLLFTQGTRPSYGAALAGDVREPWVGPVECSSLTVDRDADVTALLTGFAAAAGCFFAEATVEHDVLLSDGELVYLGPTGSPHLAPLGRWTGLPPSPVTWTWFGPAYVPLVARHLTDAVEAYGGLLHGWSEDAGSSTSWLPAALLAHRASDGGALEPAATVPRSLRPGRWSRLFGRR